VADHPIGGGHPIWPRVVWLPPSRPVWGRSNHPLAKQSGWPPLMGWPTTLFGLFFFFFFWIFFFLKKRKYDGGILGIKRLNGLNCHNLKVWGELSVTLEILEAKVKIGEYFRRIKCNFLKTKQKESKPSYYVYNSGYVC
jgi:hypothetical protein